MYEQVPAAGTDPVNRRQLSIEAADCRQCASKGTFRVPPQVDQIGGGVAERCKLTPANLRLWWQHISIPSPTFPRAGLIFFTCAASNFTLRRHAL